MDRLDELAVLVAVVEAGSLAAAARRLRRSPPAVTRILARLEERVGTRLIERTTRSLAPTEAGRSLATAAARLLADYEAALPGEAAPPRGLLRVTAPLVFGRRHIAPIINAFLDRYTEVQAELILNDRNLDMIEEDMHVALRIGPLADSSLVVRRVGEVRRVLVASPDYLARRGFPQVPADLAAHDIILGVTTNANAEWRFGSTKRRQIVRLAPRLRINDIEAVLAAVRAGRGIARVFSYQVVDEMREGTFVRLLRADEPPSLPVHLVMPSGRHPAPKVRAFVDFAVDRLAQLAVLRPGA
jgi:DNA-binding transcriptional LysR family regulator